MHKPNICYTIRAKCYFVYSIMKKKIVIYGIHKTFVLRVPSEHIRWTLNCRVIYLTGTSLKSNNVKVDVSGSCRLPRRCCSGHMHVRTSPRIQRVL